MPLDFLFRTRSSRRRGIARELREPHLEPPRRIAAAPVAAEPEPVPPVPATSQITTAVRLMSPREMAGWIHEMYMTGRITWDDYRIAIPPELDPDYDLTVGALTGQKAEPDRPRDMVQEWEERLAFVRRHCSFGDAGVKSAERIISLLRNQSPSAHGSAVPAGV